MQARTRLLLVALLLIALLGPAFYLAGVLTRGVALLDSQYPRLGLTYSVLAFSAASAAFLALRRANLVVRLVAASILLTNLGSTGIVGALWSRDMERALAEVEMAPIESPKVGILVSPADHTSHAVTEARAIESVINKMLAEGGLSPYVTVRHAYPVATEEQAKRLGERMRAHVVVWKVRRDRNPASADYHVTVLGANETDVSMGPPSLMLLMATQHTLTVPVNGTPDEHAASVLGTHVIGPIAAGFGCLTVGRPMFAAAQFNSVLEAGDLPSAALSSLRNDLALALLFLERPDLALKEYQRSVEAEPNAAAWVGIGNAAMARRDWDASAEAFAQALVLDPYDPRPYCGLGIILARQRNVRQAISSHKQAVALDPSLGVPYALLGLAYELEANVQGAREAYRYCALHAGPNAGLNVAVSERADQILHHPPTAIPTATLPPIPTPTPVPTSALYVVQRGDVLNAIADEHGVSVEAIVELNNLADPNAIFIGQTLLIPKKPE